MLTNPVDRVTVGIATHSGYPQPESVEDGAQVMINVAGGFERDGLIGELREALRGHPHVLEDKYSDFSWGASGASLEIVLHVSTLIGGVAGTVYLLEKVRSLAERRGWSIGKRDPEFVQSEYAGRSAKEAVARLIEGSSREVTIEKTQDTPWGCLVECGTPVGRFAVEVQLDGVDHITKLPPD